MSENFDNDARLPAAAGAVVQLLNAFGVDEGDHTAGTPERVAKAWAARLAGYDENPREHLQVTFTAPPDPGLVVVRNVRIQSTCAHHLLPITGRATIAYRPRPGARVVGLSKINRLAEGYARRLQVQENITAQIVAALYEELNPAWAACALVADHGCMGLRGIRDEHSDTMTFNDTGEPTESDRVAFWAAHNSGGK